MILGRTKSGKSVIPGSNILVSIIVVFQLAMHPYILSLVFTVANERAAKPPAPEVEILKTLPFCYTSVFLV